MTTTWDVIVVGGGVAGLTAGATAAAAGASTLVLEAHQTGGRARTVERDGFVFNMGGHALYAGSVGMDVLEELKISVGGSAPPLRGYKILVDGQLHAMPVGPGSLMTTSALGARSKAALAKLLAFFPRIDAARFVGMSTDEWIAEQGLRPDADGVLRALIRTGTYTDDFADLAADAAIKQMQAAVSTGVLYLDGGWGPLLDSLAARAEVRTGTGVAGIDASESGVAVETTGGERLVARSVVVAPGSPASTRALIPDAPGWGDLGDPVVAACLDLGVRGVASPGYVVGVDGPVFATTQGPPARQAPPGDSVMAVLRYRVTNAADDRAEMDEYRRLAGVADDRIAVDRFMARMVVTATMPLARRGGLAGRPTIDATGSPRVFMAGDWVGPDGLLADASFASGHAAAKQAVRAARDSATLVA